MSGARPLALALVAAAGLSGGVASSAAAAAPPASESTAVVTAGAGAAGAASAGRQARRVRACRGKQARVQAGVTEAISIRCRPRGKPRRGKRVRRRAIEAINSAEARIARQPQHGRILAISQRRDRVRYRAEQGFTGRDRFVVVRSLRGVRWRLVVRVRVREARLGAAGAECASEAVTTNYQTPIQIAVTCTGDGLEKLAVAGGPSHGALGAVEESAEGDRRTLTATYRPDDLFVGDDQVVVHADHGGGDAQATVEIEVRPWRMRAIGDSITAGFGYLGNGTEIGLSQINSCIPPTPVNNRCSSNSDEDPGYDGPVSWRDDFGLANDVAWPAQFANDWQGGGHITAPEMFKNLAVTGATPADWLPGGPFHDELEAVVAENPDLIVFTLGANPLLSRILEEGGAAECASSTDVEGLIDCIRHFFEEEQLTERLEAVYEELLAAPDAEVVTFQYHLAAPALAIAQSIPPWQLEAMIDYFNSQIAAAVQSAKADLPDAQASRLTLIRQSRDPGADDPLRVPRFHIGIPPDPNQTWTAGHECGGGFTVDGPSHQALLAQIALGLGFDFCSGDAWTINADSGIHPNRTGHAQYAAALTNVAQERGLVPELP